MKIMLTLPMPSGGNYVLTGWRLEIFYLIIKTTAVDIVM